jgi:hypothetical protein
MLGQIVTPLESSNTLQLPTNLVEKILETIAFALKEVDTDVAGSDTATSKRLARLQYITRNTTVVDLSNFNFNRDDAINYAEWLRCSWG